MKALTVRQPWAWAIVHGDKDVENRTQAWTYRGRLAIHAGAQLSQRGVEHPLIEQATTLASEFEDSSTTYDVRSAIIGVVDLVDVHHYAGSGPNRIDCCDSEWAEESYAEAGGRRRLDIVHLVLEHPRQLAEPIPCPGALGLWTPPADVLEQLEEAISA